MASNTVDLSAAVVPLIFKQEDDVQVPIRWGTKTGDVFTPYDIGDWLPKMQIRRQKTGVLVDELTLANGKFFLQESDTEMVLWIKKAVTESLVWACCEKLDYDLQITANGLDRTYIEGEITVKKQTTTG